jgi:hypothetical protein
MLDHYPVVPLVRPLGQKIFGDIHISFNYNIISSARLSLLTGLEGKTSRSLNGNITALLIDLYCRRAEAPKLPHRKCQPANRIRIT